MTTVADRAQSWCSTEAASLKVLPQLGQAVRQSYGLRKWSESNLEYVRKILNSGVEGARAGQEAGRSRMAFLAVQSDFAQAQRGKAAV